MELDDYGMLPGFPFILFGFFCFVFLLSYTVQPDRIYMRGEVVLEDVGTGELIDQAVAIYAIGMSVLLPGAALIFFFYYKGISKKLTWIVHFLLTVLLFGLTISLCNLSADSAALKRRMGEVENRNNQANLDVIRGNTIFLNIFTNCCFQEAEQADVISNVTCDNADDVAPCIEDVDFFNELDALLDNQDTLCGRRFEIRQSTSRYTSRVLEAQTLNDLVFCATGRSNYVRFLGRYGEHVSRGLLTTSIIMVLMGFGLTIYMIYALVKNFKPTWMTEVEDNKELAAFAENNYY